MSCLLVVFELSLICPLFVLELSLSCLEVVRIVLKLSFSYPTVVHFILKWSWNCPRSVFICFRVVLELSYLSYLSQSCLSVILQILELPGSCFRVNKELSLRYPRVVPKLS